jgi:glutathione-specific gamma-glutamylcyclotransferase
VDGNARAGENSRTMSDLWIFGYGSLMWKPGFAFLEASLAVISGYNRSFCIYSVHHRGSGPRPGLVLGLDRGGTSKGMAYRVAPPNARATLSYLRDREQVTGVYREILSPVTLLDGSHRHVDAIAYIAERAHPQYAGGLDLSTQAAVIRGAHGVAGPNTEYLVNTTSRLRQLGVRDRNLERLEVLLGPSARTSFSSDAVVRGMAAGASRPVLRSARNVLIPRPMPRLQNTRFGYRRRLSE